MNRSDHEVVLPGAMMSKSQANRVHLKLPRVSFNIYASLDCDCEYFIGLEHDWMPLNLNCFKKHSFMLS